jgi:hypothetical protein
VVPIPHSRDSLSKPSWYLGMKKTTCNYLEGKKRGRNIDLKKDFDVGFFVVSMVAKIQLYEQGHTSKVQKNAYVLTPKNATHHKAMTIFSKKASTILK